MYSVRLGIDTAKNRINKLIKGGHHSEALLTSVFTFEKTLHRTLKQLIVSSGFRSKDAKKLLSKVQGFKNQKEIWSCFDPQNKTLPEIIGQKHWQYINEAVTMRNNLVHGSGVYNLNKCKEVTTNVLALIDETISAFNREYGYDGWSIVSVRYKSKLHTDPKVYNNDMTSID